MIFKCCGASGQREAPWFRSTAMSSAIGGVGGGQESFLNGRFTEAAAKFEVDSRTNCGCSKEVSHVVRALNASFAKAVTCTGDSDQVANQVRVHYDSLQELTDELFRALKFDTLLGPSAKVTLLANAYGNIVHVSNVASRLKHAGPSFDLSAWWPVIGRMLSQFAALDSRILQLNECQPQQVQQVAMFLSPTEAVKLLCAAVQHLFPRNDVFHHLVLTLLGHVLSFSLGRDVLYATAQLASIVDKTLAFIVATHQDTATEQVRLL